MKKLLILIVIFLPVSLFAQTEIDIKIEAKLIFSPNDTISNEGYTKYVDTELMLKTNVNSFLYFKNIIRTYETEYGNQYYFLIGNESGLYKELFFAIFSYEELKKINTALDKLQLEASIDSSNNPYYLVHKYSTINDFQIGYVCERRKISWFMKFERDSEYNKVFVQDGEMLIKVFNMAQKNIERMQTENPNN